jgi:fructoselysine-6-P-deglycase FrlB-like protein
MRFADGIDAQPAVLARSATAVQAALSGVRPLPDGALLGLVGIGANEHIGRSAAYAWRSLGLRAVATPASELMLGAEPSLDVAVALSESGRSAETVAACARLSARKVGVTNVVESPLARVVDELLLLESGPDSPVYTTGYTATLQAVGMLGEHWAAGVSVHDAAGWAALPEQVADVLSRSRSLVDAVGEAFDKARIIDVIGSGAAAASAGEGALILREAARAHTAAHETYNYLHGPMEPLDHETACLIFGDDREVRLAQDVSSLGCPTLLVTTREVEAGGGLHVLRLPRVSPLAAAVLQILPVQLLAWRLASGRGLAVDGFRYQQDDTKLAAR